MSKYFSLIGIIALSVLLSYIMIVASHSKVRRDIHFRTKEPVTSIGQSVLLKPGAQHAVVLDIGTNWLTVVIASSEGGVKTQTVSPLIVAPWPSK